MKSVIRHHSWTALVVTLVAVEVLVRIPSFWTMLPNSSTGTPAAVVTEALQGSGAPQVVVMGSSRLKAGARPAVVAETLNLPANQVVNLSFAMGAPIDFVAIYREHRSTLRKAPIIIVGVDSWQFGWWTYTEGPLRNRFRQHAPLSWRVAAPGWRVKVDLIAGWLWRTWDARGVLNGYLHYFTDALISQQGLNEYEPNASGSDEQAATIPSEQEAIERPSLFDFKYYSFNEAQLWALVDLIALATDDGVSVFLVEAPQSPVSIKQIETEFSAQDSLWRQIVETTTGLPIEQVPFDDRRCSNWKDCFLDSGHLNAAGAVAYSEALGTWFLSRLPANSNSMPSPKW